MPQNFANENSTLVQVMAWCLMAPSHYLSQCWPYVGIWHHLTTIHAFLKCLCLYVYFTEQTCWKILPKYYNDWQHANISCTCHIEYVAVVQCILSIVHIHYCPFVREIHQSLGNWGEPTGHWWFPHERPVDSPQRASIAELWCYLWF